MNNNKLKTFWNNNILRFNVLNGLIIFFLSIVSTYQVHFWTNGIILSSPLLTFVVFSFLFIIFSINIWPWMKFNTDYTRDPRDWRWIIVSLLASYLTARYYFRIYSQGDFSIHKLWILQLLNGSVESHPFYKDLPGGIYPFIAHTIVAVITNLSGSFVQHSLIFILVVLSFFDPSYFLQVGKTNWFFSMVKFIFFKFNQPIRWIVPR